MPCRRPCSSMTTPTARARRSTRPSCCDRCRIGPASTACSTRPAPCSTSARRANLKKRVASYFQKTGHGTRIGQMVAQSRAGDHGRALRGRGAAAREQPDQDAGAALQHPVPRRQELPLPQALTGDGVSALAFHRGAVDRKHRYFGPFPSAWAVSETIQLLQKVFRLRTCEDTVFANRSRPCLLHQIKRCCAPCVGLIGEADYAATCATPTLFLQGRTDEVMARAQGADGGRRRRAAVRARGARCATRSRALSQLQSRQFVESATAGDVDVVAAAAERGLVAVNVAMIRGGRHLGDRTFFPLHADAGGAGRGAAGVRRAALRRAPGAADDRRLRLARFRGAGRGAVGAGGPARSRSSTIPARERRVWLAMAGQNATLRDRPEARAEGDAGGPPRGAAAGAGPRRARRSGSSASTSRTRWASARWPPASCSTGSRCSRREYRRFNVTPAAGGDDYAAMREALTRRCARIVAGEFPAPDLLVIDGGRGQVAVAEEVLAEQGLSGVALIGIAKGPERKAGEEDIVFPGTGRGAEPAAGPSRAAPAAADPRRGAPLRDPGPPCATGQGPDDIVAAGNRRRGPAQAAGAAGALRRAEGRAGGRRRRPRARARSQPRAGRADIRRATLTPSR